LAQVKNNLKKLLTHGTVPCYNTYIKKEVVKLPVSENNTRLAATVDKETFEEIKKLSQQEFRTISSMIAILLKEALQARKK